MNQPFIQNKPTTIAKELNVEDAPTRSGTACSSAICWIFQLLVWGGIGGAVYGKLYLSIMWPSVLFLFVYLGYMVFEFTSATFSYLRNLKKSPMITDKLGQYFGTFPVIQFNSISYHMETQRYTERDPAGRLIEKTKQVRVNTYKDTLKLNYYSAKDISGLFHFDLTEKQKRKVAFVKLHLLSEINFADAVSYSDYLLTKKAFWLRNRYLDTYMEFTETRSIANLHTHNLFLLRESIPCLVGPIWYVFWTIIPFCQLYKLFVDSYCVFKPYKVRKLISTRYNLSSLEMERKYEFIEPALSINNKIVTYDKNRTTFVNKYWKPKPPTQKQIEIARIYEDKIPHYNFSNIGETIGIVNDLPDFEEVNSNYSCPPPEFETMSGDIPLSQDQINYLRQNQQNIETNISGNAQNLPAEYANQDFNAYPPPQYTIKDSQESIGSKITILQEKSASLYEPSNNDEENDNQYPDTNQYDNQKIDNPKENNNEYPNQYNSLPQYNKPQAQYITGPTQIDTNDYPTTNYQ